MLANLLRVSVATCVVAVVLLARPAESHAQATTWHTYSFVNSPAYVSPVYATSWTAYRPSWTASSWTAYRPYQRQSRWSWFGWWPSSRQVSWSIARPVYASYAPAVVGAYGTVQQTPVSSVPQTTFHPGFFGAPYATYRPAYTYGRPAATSYYPPAASWYAPPNAAATAPMGTPAPQLGSPQLGPPRNMFDPQSPGLKNVPNDVESPSLDPNLVIPPESNTKSTNVPLRRPQRLTSPRDRTAMHAGTATIQTAAHTTSGADRAPEVIHWRPAQPK